MPDPFRSRFDVAATGIGFGAAREIGEHDSEVVEIRRRSVDTCGELQRLPLQDEFQRAHDPLRRRAPVDVGI